MKPVVSIIIPTYKRQESLHKLLRSLTTENGQYLEIIVVVQGEKRNKLPRNVKVRYLKMPSMTHARNIGTGKARGKFILFLDDDVIVSKGLIKNHVKNFRDLMVAATCGRVITPGQRLEPKYRKIGQVDLLGGVSGGFSSTIRQEVNTVIGCNMCWRRDVYIALGGVDERFTGNALREETDLSLRAKTLGYKIIFEPKAVVEHHRTEIGGARKSEGRIQWYYDLFSNETYFFLKHRMKVLLPIFWMTKIGWAIRCMFGFGREVSTRSISTPFAGMVDGVRKYKTFLQNI
ncbi:MAG: glycosyltransferase [Candidatus Gottesmanbacteria bacterium]|nr:glycosyltransferase [Candidatus Gottesmanbacteria bacterium]